MEKFVPLKTKQEETESTERPETRRLGKCQPCHTGLAGQEEIFQETET